MSAQFLEEVKMKQSQAEVASSFQLLNPNTVPEACKYFYFFRARSSCLFIYFYFVCQTYTR